MKNLLLLSLLVLLTACQTTSYSFNGSTYSSPTEAIAASDAYNHQIVSQIPATDAPLSLSLKVVLPSQSLTKAKGFISSGPKPGDEQLSYLEQIVYAGQHVVVDALQKRQLFNAVTEARSDTPAFYATAGVDYLLWFQYNETDSPAGWYLKSAETGRVIPVLYNNTAGGIDSIMSLLEGIEIAVKKLN